MADAALAARIAFDSGAWRRAYSLLTGFDRLEPDDLERLAVAAHFVGDVRASELAWERAQRVTAERGETDRAARCAFWLAFDLLLRGEQARANGWLARAERLADGAPGGAAAGFLLLPHFLATLDGGDTATALDLAEQMTEVGRATGHHDVLAFGLLCTGEALIAGGDLEAGTRCLDEAMVSITTGEVSPIPTGIIYCAVIDACMHLRDLRRAAAWTDALSTWCDSDPSVVPYRGQCLVHRSQILLARGAWDDAAEEAERARSHLAAIAHPALGEALYQQAELWRLQGALADAERGYRAASAHGREPTPGFALLRLAQGRLDAASASARRMLEQARDDPDRTAILAASIEILVAADDLERAADACDELEARAAATGAALSSAMATTARGSVFLARGAPSEAGDVLRRAIGGWHAVEMPYEEARTRVLLAEAHRALGDLDAADLELDAARATFERLGARGGRPDRHARPPSSPLTGRESEVVRLVADGRTNREVAAELCISEHTVARHLQNIFAKLGVSSRAAATAYAVKHGLV